jgi:hypothetical protein
VTRDRAIDMSCESVIGIKTRIKTQTRRMAKGPPRYEVGDRLWVREIWRTHERESDSVDGIVYKADGAFLRIENTIAAADAWVTAHNNGKHGTAYRSPRFMPRWASRITLAVTNVRTELLHRLTEEDAEAEGVEVYHSKTGAALEMSAIEVYARAWDKLHGEGAWKTNPLVHAITFAVVDIRAWNVRGSDSYVSA